MTGITILLKLLAAHLLGDFIFQGRKDAEAKNRKILTLALVKHLLIHAACILALFLFNIDYLVVIVILVSHLLIDMGKIGYHLRLRKAQERDPGMDVQHRPLIAFALDQAAHVVVIVACWAWTTGQYSALGQPLPAKIWIVLVAYLAVSLPASVFISICVKRWEEPVTGGLPNAGKLIGLIERALVLSFILQGSLAAIGFLMAAKSILRIGDLRDDKDHRKTEYILIGTLLSFSITIITGIIALYFIQLTP
ncbi:DUF3307 domain-containing protein [Hufsiella ginkgonis]|uniref:DUF3307 domain-containing protein n=1 Tax=Hufsiella ginkgonis TaxID=2695274 RepID=A0A7K1XYI4_9SPHI|nr:DUF3307 domain-containing protein [Hufsiella ginkgonis]MXV15606.1 DUF3307 domain-containing protein [Hufsiella ginkgonis]